MYERSVNRYLALQLNYFCVQFNLQKKGMRILLIKKRALAEPNAIEVTF